MITVYPYASLGHANHGWLNARHHFSFAGYRNPNRTGFGALLVINDDTIAAGRGFAPHPHHDMEIITYVRQGAITHEDSVGNKGRTGAGDVQVMSAGTGIIHSEFNRETEATTLFQIWIEPKEQGIAPRWDARAFPKAAKDRLDVLVSGRPEDAGHEPLYIHQDAAIYAGRLKAESSYQQPIKHMAYVLVSDGSITLDGISLAKGDGAEVRDQKTLTIHAQNEAELLVIDVPQAA